MRKLIKAIGFVIPLVFLTMVLFITSLFLPITRVYIYGDEKLVNLYQFYNFAKEERNIEKVKKLANEMRIDQHDNMRPFGEPYSSSIVAFSYPEHSADVVFISYEGKKITKVEFSLD